MECAVEHWTYNLLLYQQIRLRTPPPARILEVGCGYEFSAIYLKEAGYDVVGIDNNPELVDRTQKCGEFFQTKVSIEWADALDLGRLYRRFDLAFSLGVIEHFGREQAIDILKEKTKCERYVMAMPSAHSRKLVPSCEVDWVTYSRTGLRSLFKDAGLVNVAGFGYGDLVSPLHRAVKRMLPYAVYRLLQNRFLLRCGPCLCREL